VQTVTPFEKSTRQQKRAVHCLTLFEQYAGTLPAKRLPMFRTVAIPFLQGLGTRSADRISTEDIEDFIWASRERWSGDEQRSAHRWLCWCFQWGYNQGFLMSNPVPEKFKLFMEAMLERKERKKPDKLL
jgi:hypothetical protein